MTAIGPGDFVECVDAGPCRLTGQDVPLVVGQLYVVESLAPDDGLLLRGVRAVFHDEGYGFVPDRFRPIYRPRADLIERLLQPIDETTPEQVPA